MAKLTPLCSGNYIGIMRYNFDGKQFDSERQTLKLESWYLVTFSDQRGLGACARPAPVGVRQAANHLLEQKVVNIIQVGRQSDPRSSDFQKGKCLLTKKRFCGREVWNVSPKRKAPYKVVTFLKCPNKPSPLLWSYLSDLIDAREKDFRYQCPKGNIP